MKKKELDNAAERQLKEEARKLRREEKRRQKLLKMEEVFKKRLVLKMKAQQEKQKEINREKARLEIQVKVVWSLIPFALPLKISSLESFSSPLSTEFLITQVKGSKLSSAASVAVVPVAVVHPPEKMTKKPR